MPRRNWTTDERHALHIMAADMGMTSWQNMRDIFNALHHCNETISYVRDEYNQRNRDGRSMMWAREIDRSSYTDDQQRDRNRVAGDIRTEAARLNISIPNANPATIVNPGPAAAGAAPAPMPMLPMPTSVPASQPATTSAVPSVTTMPQQMASLTVLPGNPASTSAFAPAQALPTTHSASNTTANSTPQVHRSHPVLAGHPDPSELIYRPMPADTSRINGRRLTAREEAEWWEANVIGRRQ